MTRMISTTAGLVAILAASLAACATPTYPVKAGYTAPPPIRPRYPDRVQSTPAVAPAPAPVPPAASPVPEAAPPSPVESQALPPATGAPITASVAPSPAQSALPPDYAPPSPTPEAPAPAPVAAPPPPVYRAPEPAYRAPETPYRAPEVRYRSGPARYIADGKVVAAKGMFRDYEVQKHDHLDAIARDLQTTRTVLVEANRLKAPYDLQPGQHLKVPVAKAYEIASGDTMSAVAKRFGVSPSALADLNDLPARGRLRPGEKLALPPNYDDHGPTKLPSIMVAENVPSARAVYRPPARPSSTVEQEGPYVPSPWAVAAAQRLAITRSYGPPTYVPGRPSPNAAIPAAPARTYAYSPPAYSPPAAPALSQAAVVQAARGRFIWPVRGQIIAPFGVMGVGRRNDGVDVRSPQGTVVHAAAAGNVVYAGDQVPGFGNLVLIKHADGWVTAYAHLDRLSVQMRQMVTQGQEVGEVGQTGGVSEPQLHFEVRYAPTPADKARPVDPLLVLPK